MTIINIYILNNRPLKYMKWKLTELKRKIGSFTIIVRDFNIVLSIMDKASRQKVSEEIEDMNNKINQLSLIDIHRTFYWTTSAYILFIGVHGTFFRIDHVLSHNRFKRIDIIYSTSSDHIGMKLEMNNRRKN